MAKLPRIPARHQVVYVPDEGPVLDVPKGESYDVRMPALIRPSYFSAHHGIYYVKAGLSQPTNLRGVSTTETTISLLWNNNHEDATGVEVHRALEDGAFSLIDTVAATVITFLDSGLATGTRYRYKVRATDGSATSDFSNIETVVTQTCNSDTGFNREISLPRFDDEDTKEQWMEQLNQMSQRLEDKFNTQIASDKACDICVVNGAIVLDAGRCNNFKIAVNAPINSISVINSVPGQHLELVFVPDGTHTISGLPAKVQSNACGTLTDPMITTLGILIKLDLITLSDALILCETEDKSGGEGVGGGTAMAIECEQVIGDEDWTTVLANCALMDCLGGDPKLNFRVTGGVGPYSWSILDLDGNTGAVLTISGGAGENVTAEPPTQTTVSGGAYRLIYAHCVIGWNGTNCTGSGSNLNVSKQDYGCEDQLIGNCDASAHNGTCKTIEKGCGEKEYCADGFFALSPPTVCTTGKAEGRLEENCDRRTAQMITDGCKPCGLVMDGAVLTVTDALGNSVAITLGTSGTPAP